MCFCKKGEIIKKLVEIQCTVLDTISAKFNNCYSNFLNQANFSLPSKNPYENSQNTKELQLGSQEEQHPPIQLPCSPQLQEIWHPIQANYQRLERNITMKSIYVAIYQKIL